MFIRHPALTAVPRHRPEPLALTGLRVQLRRARDRRYARRCRSLAAGYERLVTEADRPLAFSRFSAQVPVHRAAVRAVKPELRGIAAALCSDRRPPEEGFLAARRLMCDGCGPLYVSGDLTGEIQKVLALLRRGGPPRRGVSGPPRRPGGPSPHRMTGTLKCHSPRRPTPSSRASPVTRTTRPPRRLLALSIPSTLDQSL